MIKASRLNARSKAEEDDTMTTSDGRHTPVSEDAPEEDDDEVEPAPKPKPKKQKKVIPVGRNGLKKRRVVKSRQSFDEKGYMCTSSYPILLSGWCFPLTP